MMNIPARKKKKNDPYQYTNDILIVFNSENKTSEIHYVDHVDNEKVNVDGRFSIPITDLEVTTGEHGRNFFYRAPTKSITATENIAKLEKTVVLEKIANFKPQEDNAKKDLTKVALFGLVFFAFVIVAIIAN